MMFFFWVLNTIVILAKLAFWIGAIWFFWWFAGGSWVWFVPLFLGFVAAWRMLSYIRRCIWHYMKTEWGWTVMPGGDWWDRT